MALSFWPWNWGGFRKPAAKREGGQPLYQTWRSRWHSLQEANGSGAEGAYFKANCNAIKSALDGRGPDDTVPIAGDGARMVVNIASTHLVAFCEAAKKNDPKPYKNYYDLGKHQVGETAPNHCTRKRRELVDEALPVLDYKNSYFGAVELCGTGVHFYGDYCLVLHPAASQHELQVLDRNSYDVIREPLSTIISNEVTQGGQLEKRKELLQDMAGRWGSDLCDIVSLRMLGASNSSLRRVTTGQVSQGMLSDEDYIEVLRQGSFGPQDLEEARTSATDVALEARIIENARDGSAPPLSEQLWCRQRRCAEMSLRKAGVRVRVPTAPGRVRQ